LLEIERMLAEGEELRRDHVVDRGNPHRDRHHGYLPAACENLIGDRHAGRTEEKVNEDVTVPGLYGNEPECADTLPAANYAGSGSSTGAQAAVGAVEAFGRLLGGLDAWATSSS